MHVHPKIYRIWCQTHIERTIWPNHCCPQAASLTGWLKREGRQTPSVLPRGVCPGPMGTSEKVDSTPWRARKWVAFGCSYEGLMAQQRERADPSIDYNENKDWSQRRFICLVGTKGCWGVGVGVGGQRMLKSTQE